ncbi:MAG: DUF1559 domain-containing protein [Armatimonadia bacterium]
MQKMRKQGTRLQNRRKGFTLIELLVVIAIIAILAAILFPVFAKAREKARQTSCLNNLKQIGTAFIQYAQDYDERMPLWGLNITQTDATMPGTLFITAYNGSTTGYLTSWMDITYPYIKNRQVFVCPSAVNREANAPSYGYNRLVSGYIGGPAPKSLGQITRPAEIILCLDYASRYGSYANVGEYNTFKAAGNYVCPHNDGTNVNFCDGHSKWLSKTDVAFADISDNTNRSWNPTLP